jgi:hypothetical protein
MKERLIFFILIGLFFSLNLAVAKPSLADVTIEVLNPRGEIEPPKSVGLSPRLTDLSDKTIGLYDIGKEGFAQFLDVTEKLLKQKYPSAKIKRYNGAFDIGQRLAVKIAKEVDTVLYGSGD